MEDGKVNVTPAEQDAIIIEGVRLKLNPRRFPNMSPVMKAIVCHVLDLDAQTEPAIAELIVTSDGMLLARNEGDYGANDFIGGASDYRQNWERLITMDEVGLTPDEVAYVRRLYNDAARRA